MKSVTIYTRQFCGFCTAAKYLLTEKGIHFIERDTTHSPDLRQEMINKSQGLATFPQIFIGNEHIGGCDDLFTLERDNVLDEMLEG